MSLYSPRRVRAQPRLLFLSTDALQEAIQRKKCRRLGCAGFQYQRAGGGYRIVRRPTLPGDSQPSYPTT